MADLSRFIEAQNPVWESVRRELRDGRKAKHWMWFVFPQIDGLGRSAMAQRYAIASLDEARAYLVDPVLGPRLREAVGLLLAHRGMAPESILGSIDAMKLRSSLTLFEKAAPEEPAFADALNVFYGGEEDPATLDILGA
jgi:uncharacterized protein (DUF1810 family)